MLHWREWLHITNSRCARQHTDRNGRECGPRMDSPPLLDPKASSALRDRLRRNSRALARSRKLQLGPIGCAAPRAPWSRADAEYIEATFWQKLAEFEDRAGWATPQGPFRQIGSTAPRRRYRKSCHLSDSHGPSSGDLPATSARDLFLVHGLRSALPRR
jgi:hypothetical protein